MQAKLFVIVNKLLKAEMFVIVNKLLKAKMFLIVNKLLNFFPDVHFKNASKFVSEFEKYLHVFKRVCCLVCTQICMC